MRKKILLLVLGCVLMLTACQKEKDTYESKGVKVESVFDKIDFSKTENGDTETNEKTETGQGSQVGKPVGANETEKPEKNVQGEKPEGEDPEGQNPDEENPEAQNPDEENPEAQNPDEENPEAQNPDGPADGEEPVDKLTKDYVNFRETPEINNNNILLFLKSGRKVSVLEEGLGDDGAWSKVTYKDQEGYIMTEYLEDIE